MFYLRKLGIIALFEPIYRFDSNARIMIPIRIRITAIICPTILMLSNGRASVLVYCLKLPLEAKIVIPIPVIMKTNPMMICQ